MLIVIILLFQEAFLFFIQLLGHSLSSFSLCFPFLSSPNFFVLHLPSIGTSVKIKSSETCLPCLHFSQGSFLLSSHCTLFFRFSFRKCFSLPSPYHSLNCIFLIFLCCLCLNFYSIPLSSLPVFPPCLWALSLFLLFTRTSHPAQ